MKSRVKPRYETTGFKGLTRMISHAFEKSPICGISQTPLVPRFRLTSPDGQQAGGPTRNTTQIPGNRIKFVVLWVWMSMGP